MPILLQFDDNGLQQAVINSSKSPVLQLSHRHLLGLSKRRCGTQYASAVE